MVHNDSHSGNLNDNYWSIELIIDIFFHSMKIYVFFKKPIISIGGELNGKPLFYQKDEVTIRMLHWPCSKFVIVLIFQYIYI